MLKFQLSDFESEKMMLLKGYTQYANNLENSAVGTGLEKISFHSVLCMLSCSVMSSTIFQSLLKTCPLSR